MSPRIHLDDSLSDAPVDPVAELGVPPASSTRQLLDANWEKSDSEPLMLYVADEPCVGLEFSYHGLDWQIVEYSDGWVAQLLVD